VNFESAEYVCKKKDDHLVKRIIWAWEGKEKSACLLGFPYGEKIAREVFPYAGIRGCQLKAT